MSTKNKGPMQENQKRWRPVNGQARPVYLEPYAFLGAWLERRGVVYSKAEHVACTPNAADVLSYARRKLVWQG